MFMQGLRLLERLKLAHMLGVLLVEFLLAHGGIDNAWVIILNVLC